MKKFSEKFNRITVALVVATSMVVFNNCASDDGDDGGTKTYLTEAGESLTLNNGDTLQYYNAGTVTVTADAEITLKGTVVFESGSKLVVNEGATIKGDTSVLSYLIIDRGADIEAIGTQAKPITFTSSKADGSRGAQDWGGIIINGYAKINSGDTAQGEGDSGTYGGTDDADNSGTLKYVRVMFAGKDFSSDNELNGIALQGVGSGTTLEYIQVHNNKDDGIEMFGGNVNIRYLMSTANGDDQIDATDGWRGTVQFAVAAPITGDKGLEHDGNSTTTATPYTEVYYANLTVVRGDTPSDSSDANSAIRNREGAKITYYNTFVGDYSGTAGNAISKCLDNSDDTATITVDSSVHVNACGSTTSGTVSGAPTSSGSITANATSITDGSGNEIKDLATFASQNASLFVPSGAFATNANTDLANVTLSSSDSSSPTFKAFTDADYIGAFENGGTNWASTWTSFPAN